MAAPMGQAATHTYTVEQEDLHPNIDIDVVDGHYIAVKKVKDGEEEVYLPEQRINEDTYFYAIRLSAVQLEAGRKIFYDRWNFVTGDDSDRELFEACEQELEHRRENTWSLHSHQMPAHSHSMGSYPASGMPASYAVGNVAYHSHGDHNHSQCFQEITEKVWRIPAE